MSKKGENIYKRKDGRWEARYPKGYMPSGKIKYGFCYGKTYREAKEKAERMKACAYGAASPPKEAVKKQLKEYCGGWLDCERVKVKESTYIRYETIIERHIVPVLGGLYPNEVSDRSISLFTKTLLSEKKLSAKTVKDVLAVLRSVLRYTARQFPGRYPEIQIFYPKEVKKNVRILTLEEEKTFISYLSADIDPCKFGVLLAMCTGLRIGEMCALRWENISLSDRLIYISSTMQRIKNDSPDSEKKTKIIIGEPKSDSSVRYIPLTNELAELCRRMTPDKPAAFVLTGETEYMEPRSLQYRLQKYTSECGLDGVHFHTLRHSFATRCVEAGFEIKSLSEILGHADTSITLNRYVHSSMELKRENMRKLASAGFDFTNL